MLKLNATTAVCIQTVHGSAPAAQGAAQALLVAGLRAGRLPLLHRTTRHVGVHLAAAATWHPAAVATVAAAVATIAAAASAAACVPFPVLQRCELECSDPPVCCSSIAENAHISHQMQEFDATSC